MSNGKDDPGYAEDGVLGTGLSSVYLKIRSIYIDKSDFVRNVPNIASSSLIKFFFFVPGEST